MDDALGQLRSVIDDLVASSERPGKRLALQSLLAHWQTLHEQGVGAYDFAHASVLMAETVMSYYESLDENIHFGEYLKESGASKIRCVREYWPPVDPEQWPDGWPDHLK